MSKLLVLVLAFGLLAVPVISIAADEKEDPKPKEKTKEKEKTKAKPKETVEWSQITSGKGELKKPEYKSGQRQVKAEPKKVEFSNEAAAFRVKWKTSIPEGKRGGSLAMTLYKKETRGEKESYKRGERIGNARGESEGTKVLTAGKGDYYIELDGDAIIYEITVESAEKKAAE